MNTRKANRLKEYDYSRPGAYFVTICLADRMALLGSIVGADDHIGPTNSIPQRIKTFKTLVAKELGRSIFQRSYHDHIIRNEEDYLQIWKYIDDNPAKWESDPFYRK